MWHTQSVNNVLHGRILRYAEEVKIYRVVVIGVNIVAVVKVYATKHAFSEGNVAFNGGALPDKVILIAGGYDKQIPFEPMAPFVADKVKVLILSGPTAEKIEAAVTRDPYYSPEKTKIIKVQNMQEAVAAAHENAVAGDVVTLSPACASFDAYPNFVARGNHYKELVNAL